MPSRTRLLEYAAHTIVPSLTRLLRLFPLYSRRHSPPRRIHLGTASPATDCRHPRIGRESLIIKREYPILARGEGTGFLPPISSPVLRHRFGRGSPRSRTRQTSGGGGHRCRCRRHRFPHCTNRRAATLGPRSNGQVHRGSVITSSGVARFARPRTEAVRVRARRAEEVVSTFA